jgi:hypothetical protein
MKVEIINLVNGHLPVTIDGSPEEIEIILREMFPGHSAGVPQGDLYGLAREIGRSSYVFLTFLDEQPQRKPHLNPQERAYPEDPWVREDDFGPHLTMRPKRNL